MNTKIKTSLALLLLLAVSCKKESNILQSAQYPSVWIGTQKWMTRNLDVTHYRNGDTIPEVRDQVKWGALTTGAWSWYNNDSSTYGVYGKLYNWYAVNDPRGLAPLGWHVPSDAEWTTLSTYLGNNAGGKLKDTGTIQAGTGLWYAPNTGATNKSGFTGLAGGYRASGEFTYIGEFAVWWTSSDTIVGPWNRTVVNTYGLLFREWSFKPYGYSVRCIEDK